MSYNVLIIGCGAIAGGYDTDRSESAGPLTHAGAYRRDGRFRLVACVDPDASRREAFARRWLVGAAFADLNGVRSAQAFDAISICSPTSLHAEHLDAAIAMKPRLIFCEKPVTASVEDTRRIVTACDAAGIKLAVGHLRRWDPKIAALRAELRAGKWGAIRAASGTYNKGVLNNGSHMIDLLHFFLGPLELTATGDPVHDFWDNDPTVPVLLTAQGGVPVTLGVAHAADYALFELSLVTEQGVLTMEDGGGVWRLRARVDSSVFPGYRNLNRGDWQEGGIEAAMLAAVAEIHGALAEGKPLSSTGHSAADAQTLCEAIRDAALARRH